MASRSWNRVELIGNMTRDPELRFTPSGAAVCTFSIATNRTYVSDGEKKEEVDFHRCVSWNKLAELCNQLLKKGNRVFVSGRLQNRSWEAQDGQQRNITEIVIEDMIVLTPKGEYTSSSNIEDVSVDESKTPPTKPAESPDASQVEAAFKEEPEKKEKEQPQEEPKKAPTEDVSPDEDLPF